MGVFSFWAGATPTMAVDTKDTQEESSRPSETMSARTSESVEAAEVDTPESTLPPSVETEPKGTTPFPTTETPAVDPTDPTVAVAETAMPPRPTRARRFSLKRLSFSTPQKAAISMEEEGAKETHAAEAAHHAKQKMKASSASEKRAKQSALDLRTIMVGRAVSLPKGKSTLGGVTIPELSKIKNQLNNPKTANKLIAQLRALPASESQSLSQAPCIHAVCLDLTEEEAEKKHFVHLDKVQNSGQGFAPPTFASSATATTVDSLSTIFADMHLVSLINTPDLGFGQAANKDGIFAGAVPTAETVIQGIKQITPQLMKLGYIMGSSVVPDHTGVYPPTDRLSVLTYWWGLEVVLPSPTLVYLANAQSISTSVMNCLSALAMIHNGVREILPFVRYISQYIDFEFSSIQRVNKGQGVVCAATWVMPAAMIPRAWDFESAPGSPTEPPTEAGETPSRPPPLQQDAFQGLAPVEEEPAGTPVRMPEPEFPTPPTNIGSSTEPGLTVSPIQSFPMPSPVYPTSFPDTTTGPLPSPAMGGMASSPLRLA